MKVKNKNKNAITILWQTLSSQKKSKIEQIRFAVEVEVSI